MEHIVQFAISIDDKTIQKKLEERGYDDIIDRFKEEFYQHFPKAYYGRKIDWDSMIKDGMIEFLKDYKEEIIDAAAEKLCESFKRTKVFKEKMKESME